MRSDKYMVLMCILSALWGLAMGAGIMFAIIS